MISECFSESTSSRIDLCVVGAGPVGLTLALSLARRGCKVDLLEAGGTDPDVDTSGAFALDLVHPENHASADLGSRQGLGGTSSVWGGGCMPLDDTDFRKRPWLANSDWPISEQMIARHYDAACDLLCIPRGFHVRQPEDDPDADVEMSNTMRFCSIPNFHEVHEAEITASPLLHVHLNTRVERLHFCPGGTGIEALTIACRDQKLTIRPKVVILCCGGIQSARLLLVAQRANATFLHGEKGALGRYYTGHISGVAARIRFDTPKNARRFVIHKGEQGHFERNYLALSAEAQARHHLLNQYFALSSLPIGDPSYRSGSLSLVHLVMTLRHGTPRYIENRNPRHIRTEFEFGVNPLQHLGTIVSRPYATTTGLVEILASRIRRSKIKPLFCYYNPAGTYGLSYHSEHTPSRESRVTLSTQVDAHDVPVPKVDLRFSDVDFQSIIASHRVLDEWLHETGMGRIEWHVPEAYREAHIREQASDGYHQMGLTRMSDDARTGVVDKDLKVHGMSNLYVASPGVLVTGGRAHPTFPCVALALRLADHLVAPLSVAAGTSLPPVEPGQPHPAGG